MVCVVFGVGVLQEVTSGAVAVSGTNMSAAEALAVLPPEPVVGVSVGLPVSLGVGVGLADVLSLGVGVGLTDALAVGEGVLLGDGVGVQATAGSAVVPFFLLAAAAGPLGFTPIGGCHRPGLARPVAAVGSCC